MLQALGEEELHKRAQNFIHQLSEVFDLFHVHVSLL